MVEKIKSEEPLCKTVVELTPDELIMAARKLQLAANKAQPGQEILLNLTASIVLKYDPKISQNAAGVRKDLAGTSVSSLLDNAISDKVKCDEQFATASH